jgi:transposase
MGNILTEAERTKLLSHHRLEKDKRVADRIKVVLLFDTGWSADKISAALFLDDSTIRRHLSVYEDEKRLKGNHKGSEPILTKAESTLLSDHLEAETYVKVKDIQSYVRKFYQKEMCVSTLTACLKKNGFSYKKPKLNPKGDPELQKQFVEAYSNLMNQASLDDTPVLFGDSVHPSQQTRPSYGWIKKGKDKIIEIHSGRKRLNVMGAINLESIGFEYNTFDTINSQATIVFLEQIERSYTEAARIDLILDNAGYHRSCEVTEYLKTSRVNVHSLPLRSPNLNAIERLWKIMHEHVSSNKVYEKFKDFKKAVLEFFDRTMPNIYELLLDRLTDNFHLTSCA